MADNNLKNILIKEGIQQEELARACGISVPTINRFANGKRTPSQVTAYKILNALNKFENIRKQYYLNEIFPTVKAVD
jgi:transcriptional regulator with XRE-family HTH domain